MSLKLSLKYVWPTKKNQVHRVIERIVNITIIFKSINVYFMKN